MDVFFEICCGSFMKYSFPTSVGASTGPSFGSIIFSLSFMPMSFSRPCNSAAREEGSSLSVSSKAAT